MIKWKFIFHIMFSVIIINLGGISNAWSKIKIESPKPFAFVHAGKLLVQVTGCKKKPTVELKLHDTSFYIGTLETMPYTKTWFGFVPLPAPPTPVDLLSRDLKRVQFEVTCGRHQHREVIPVIDGLLRPYQTIGLNIAHHLMEKKAAEKMAWDWGPAIYLYGLLKFARTLPSFQAAPMVEYAASYHRSYQIRGTPVINWADKVAPALSGHELMVTWNNPVAQNHLTKAMTFLREEKRNELGSLDHFGTKTFMAKFYPSSIWVDSLMMWGILTVLHGELTHDENLARWGLEQPQIFYQTLKQENSGMLHHAWNISKHRPQPRHNTPWLRGNGWVMAAMAVLLEESTLVPNSTLAENFQALAASALNYQLPNGLYDTLLTQPGEGYEETSGSALIAFAFLKGVQLGILGDEFRQSALKTFTALSSGLIISEAGHSLDNVSWLTMPYGKTLYRAIPRLKDVSYGVGSFLLLLSAVNQSQERDEQDSKE
jgi:unsaturated rhamnogalacturonyl hydrolase